MKKQILFFLQFFLIATISLIAGNCSLFTARSEQTNNQSNSNSELQVAKTFGPPKQFAILADETINESSGLAVSHKNKNVFWTHNDSGDGPFLYAFNQLGQKLGVWRVTNAKNVDWEDIAAYQDRQTGESYLLIGDTGNNERFRSEAVIYRVVEPKVTAAEAATTKKNPGLTEKAEAIRVAYPDQRRDAETLMVNPNNNDLYIVSKSLSSDADVYKLSPPFDFVNKNALKRVGTVGVDSLTRGFFTGGDISIDGRKLVLCDYFAAYEFILPDGAESFDEIWRTNSEKIELGERAQGESICYGLDSEAVFATSEKRPTPLIKVARK